MKLAAALALTLLAGTAQASGINVGIYSGAGAAPDKTLALYRAVAAAGHTPQAITRADLLNDRLTTANFDVFILPAGKDGNMSSKGHYADNTDALGSKVAKDAIREYLESGGGMVGIEAGAYFACKTGATLRVYDAKYVDVSDEVGKKTLTVTDPSFGSGTLESWHSVGGGYFDTTPTSTVVATNSAGEPVIVRDSFGPGRVILTSMDLELRGDSELDWTIWDNWEMGSHSGSEKNWELLGRMIGWAYNGDSAAPTINPAPLPAGARVAVLSTRNADGGAWPDLLPAVGRSIEFSGHLPLSIRMQDVNNGLLTNSEFDVLTVPGGLAEGYKTGMEGHEQKIRDFISAGGDYYGIGAGGFYAAGTLHWDGQDSDYPLDVYEGLAFGALSDIAPWPGYALTPTAVADPVFGGPYTMMQTYCGGPYFTIPVGMDYSPVSTYAYTGQFSGMNSMIRYTYGDGHVVLTGTNPELRAGTIEDWTFWDDYDLDNQPISNPDNPWLLVDQLFNNWLLLGGTVSIERGGGPDDPSQLSLAAPTPNPFTDRVSLSVRLPEAGGVGLTIHDIRGRLLTTLASGRLAAGEHRFEWSGMDDGYGRVADGIYFVRLENNGQVQTRKIVLTRGY